MHAQSTVLTFTDEMGEPVDHMGRPLNELYRQDLCCCPRRGCDAHPRRLVNSYVVGEYRTDFGTTYTAHISGAWGRPEEAVAYAEIERDRYVPVWQGRDGYPQRVVGVHIIDVETCEQWTVPV